MIYESFNNKRRAGEKSLAVLLDPDKLQDSDKLQRILNLIRGCKVDYIFVGGSLMVNDHFDSLLTTLKSSVDIPLVIFPGSVDQVSSKGDAILLLSLISGRNPELLIGNHVLAAPRILKANLESISTGYMLIDCGKQTTASYMSNTMPIPYNKPEIARITALAGEMLGMKCMYLDGGSGADRPVSNEMIAEVGKQVDLPLIVGGGIRTEQQAKAAWDSGADIIVIGTAFEDDPETLIDICSLKNDQEYK